MPNKRRLVIHAGAGKCGSTSIQRTVRANARDLNALGFACKASIADFNGYFKAGAAGDGDAAAAWLDSAANGRNLVLSGEGLSNIHALELFQAQPVFQDWDAHVVLFVRPQDSWFVSAWWQWGAYIQPRRTVAEMIGSFIEERSFMWAAKAVDWTQVQGVESVTVVPITHCDPVRYFMETVLGLTDYTQVATANKRVPQTVHAMLHAFPTLKKNAHDNKFLKSLLSNTAANLDAMKTTPAVLSQSDVERLNLQVFPTNADLREFVPTEYRAEFASDPRWQRASVTEFRDPSISRPEPAVDEHELRELLGLPGAEVSKPAT